MEKKNYRKLALALTISFFVMYCVMFLNVDDIGHVYLSLTRLYMSLLMVCPMAVIMLMIMKGMYKNRKLNAIIISSSLVVFMLSLVFLRHQAFISDREYMQAMIPHHSSAILTSKHAHITDPEMKKLSDGIIESQQREINQMKQMLQRLED